MVCKNRGVYGFLGTSWVLITLGPRNSTVFAENVVWVKFLVVCFLYKINPNPRKNTCGGKKVAQMPLLKFSWGGLLALGWGVRRFRTNIYMFMFSNPTKIGKSQRPCYFVIRSYYGGA